MFFLKKKDKNKLFLGKRLNWQLILTPQSVIQLEGLKEESSHEVL